MRHGVAPATHFTRLGYSSVPGLLVEDGGSSFQYKAQLPLPSGPLALATTIGHPILTEHATTLLAVAPGVALTIVQMSVLPATLPPAPSSRSWYLRAVDSSEVWF